ncbi:VCBS repeat-containing protein, partial [Candidatus Sumerlaeota bacterium]|nr:VCBS repeat-containing protein [Candidatus Sumerlaeota bacterium]
MKQYLLSRLTRMPLLILLALVGLAGTARGATSLQFFFPIDNDLANTIDDEIVVKPVAWSSASQPVNWVLLKPNNSSVLVPTFNTNNISDAEVLTALEAALTEWNNGGLSSFTFEDDVLFSTSVAVPNPRPTDAGLDTHNLMTFQSQLVTLESGAIAETSIYFMERDFDLQAFMGMPIDNIEPGVVLPFDLNGDGFADVSLPARNYKQAEIIETDIIFNSSLIYYQWPANRSDIPSTQLPFLLGSNDIQSTMVHELGHAHGLGHSYIEASTMYPFLNDVTADFPSDPYDVRQIAYDDKLGAGLIYPNFSGTGGEIRGWVIDGQAIDIFDALPQPLDLDNVDPAVNDSLFVVEAPVFLGVPAPPGLHPDNVASAEGVIRLIAQVTSGQSLRYPAGSGGVVDLEPSLTTDPNIDFADNGEDADQDGILDVGEDLNANGVLDPTTRKIDSKFRFAGLAPRDDYAIYIDQDVLGLGEPIAISPAFNFLGGLESFPAEFYGGVTSSSSKIDDATGDDPQELEFISVAGGAITNNIIVITNTDTTSGGGGGDDGTTPDGSATPPLKFVEDPLAIGNTDYVALGSDIGDLNGDGYLDIVVAVFSGGSDVGGGKFNRVYLNVPANPSDPKSKRFFKDITFGADGVPGTTDDILPANSENSRDCKLGDFNNDGRLDLFVVNAADQNSLPGYGGFNRLYTNEEDSGNIYGFRFRDVSQSTMPGLLNRG